MESGPTYIHIELATDYIASAVVISDDCDQRRKDDHLKVLGQLGESLDDARRLVRGDAVLGKSEWMLCNVLGKPNTEFKLQQQLYINFNDLVNITILAWWRNCFRIFVLKGWVGFLKKKFLRAF